MKNYWNWKMCKVSNYRPFWLSLVISLLIVNGVSCNGFGLEEQGHLGQVRSQNVPSTVGAVQESANYYDTLTPNAQAQQLPLPLTGGATALQSDEDPINHSLEQFPTSTENSVFGTSDYISNQVPGYQETDYNVNKSPPYQATGNEFTSNTIPAFQSSSPDSLLASDGMLTTTTESPGGLMGDPGQLSVSQHRLGTVYSGDGGYSVDPVMVGQNQVASDRILVRHSIRKKIKLPVYTTVFSHHRVIPDRPPRGRHQRYKRKPRRGKPKPTRQRGRGRGRGRRPHSRGGPSPPQQHYGLGSMQLPTYAPAFVSYGPIYGPPPGIQIKHPVQNQAYGLPSQQNMAYVPVVQHGSHGMVASPNTNYGYPPQQPPYLPPPGNSLPPPSNDHYRQPALTISVEAPSNMYSSPPQNIDGTPVVRVKPPSNMYMPHSSQLPPPAGPHPVPGFGVPVPIPSNAIPNYGPPRPPVGPPPVTGPSYLAPIQVQSAQPPRYAQPMRPQPAYGQSPSGNYYQATNQYGYSAPPQTNYNPPMHYGSPMHNFGPPMSSLGQPPPIMDDPMIDKWAPPTGFNSYPGGAGYSSHEHTTRANNDHSTRYPPNEGYRSAKSNYYKNKNKDGRGKYHDFHASAEDHYGHSDETSTSNFGNFPPPNSGSYGSSSSSYGSATPNSGDYGSSSSTPGYYGNDSPPQEYGVGSRKPRNKQRKPSYDDMSSYDKDSPYNSNSGSNGGYPGDDFFTASNFQSDALDSERIPSPRRPWRRRRTESGTGIYKGGSYENYVNPNDRKGDGYDYSSGKSRLKIRQRQSASFETVDGTRPVRNRGSGSGKDYSTSSPTRSSLVGQYDSNSRSEGSSGSKYARPIPKYDTEYNSPGMSKDQKVTDWFDYAERTRNQKLKLGYPRNYKKKVTRYRTLPDSVDNYSADPNHRKYPKLTYDSLIKRIAPDEKGPKFLTEETKVAVFKTGSEFKKMLNDHDNMRI